MGVTYLGDSISIEVLGSGNKESMWGGRRDSGSYPGDALRPSGSAIREAIPTQENVYSQEDNWLVRQAPKRKRSLMTNVDGPTGSMVVPSANDTSYVHEQEGQS